MNRCAYGDACQGDLSLVRVSVTAREGTRTWRRLTTDAAMLSGSILQAVRVSDLSSEDSKARHDGTVSKCMLLKVRRPSRYQQQG